jgi:hypothetical protein
MSVPEITALDIALARAGQTVSIRQSNASGAPIATVMALVRGISADEVAGAITQSDKRVVLSPTGIDDSRMPKAGGFIVIDGVPRAIVGTPEYLKIANTLVRINVVVKG